MKKINEFIERAFLDENQGGSFKAFLVLQFIANTLGIAIGTLFWHFVFGL